MIKITSQEGRTTCRLGILLCRVRRMMDFNHVLRAIGVALMLAVLFTTPVRAQRSDRGGERYAYKSNCKDETIKASGSAVWRPFSLKREINGEGAAFANAVVNWQREVWSKYGEHWMDYDNARGKQLDGIGREDTDCRPDARRKNMIRCIISGNPCAMSPEAIDPGSQTASPGCQFGRGDIKQAQRFLNSCDKECDGEIDGILGGETEKCLKQFQRRFSLRVSGQPCVETLRALQGNCGVAR
jgi:hypothetical protein